MYGNKYLKLLPCFTFFINNLTYLRQNSNIIQVIVLLELLPYSTLLLHCKYCSYGLTPSSARRKQENFTLS